MKHVQVRTAPDSDLAPPIFQLIAQAPFVRETRLVDWNLADRPTALFVVEGDRERVRSELESMPGTDWDLAPIEPGRTYLRASIDPGPLLSSVVVAMQTAGVIVVKPIVYRDGYVYVRLVGDAEQIQDLLAAMPDGAKVTLEGIKTGAPTRPEPSTLLSDRQREAVRTALELGYYDQPRGATHADVADELGCSSSTASEHLQKAEATVLKEVFSTADVA